MDENQTGEEIMLALLEKCPGCGGDVCAEEAPGGLCPVCLMRRGLELANTIDFGEQSTPTGSCAFSPPDPLELEADLPDFDVIGLVGQGGMGAVYKARHRGLDRVVAIKILPRHESANPERAERFQREARALARLKHEHIVMAFDIGSTDHYSYFVMELIDGPNLRQLLAAGELPPERALTIAQEICEGLRYAHENGVIHRDIKPENVLIDPSGRAKIADFGLAKLFEPNGAQPALTSTRQRMGTPHYMAPEQTESPQSADHRSDIYALGVLTYEMLTGELPIGVFDPPSKKCAVDAPVDDVVLRALAKDPERRFETAAEFSAAIVALLDRDDVSPRALNSPKTRVGGMRRVPRAVFIAAGFAAALVIGFLGWQFLLKYQKDHEGNVDLTISASGDNKSDSGSAPASSRVPPAVSSMILPVRPLRHDGMRGGLLLPNGNAYFFRGSKYVRYDFAADKVDKTGRIGTDGWWGVWDDGFDAALMHPSGKAFFFRGDKFQRYDFKPRADGRETGVDKSGLIGTDGWWGVWQDGVQAAVLHPNGKAYFFRGKQYQRYDFTMDRVDKTATIGSDGWWGLWDNGFDAAILHPNGKAYFFRDGQFQRYNLNSLANTKDVGVDEIGRIGVDGWHGLDALSDGKPLPGAPLPTDQSRSKADANSSATSESSARPVVEFVGGNEFPLRPAPTFAYGSGEADRATENQTEDLQIQLSNPLQRRTYPDRTLTVDYEISRVAQNGRYYLVIDGNHIGRHAMEISGYTFAAHGAKGRLLVSRMPEAGNGEPLRIYVEVERPAVGRSRLRVSNILKTTVQDPGAPSTDIRYPNRLPAPFAAIHWEDSVDGSSPQVEIKGEWYELLEINEVAVREIMKLAEKTAPSRAQEQFEDSLPELLDQLGHKPGATVNLKVRKNAAEGKDEILHDVPFGQNLTPRQ
jgi:serine/threonine protein kinase